MIYAISYGATDHGNTCKNVQRALRGMDAIMATDTLWFVDTEMSVQDVDELIAPCSDMTVMRVHKDYSFRREGQGDPVLIGWLRDPQRCW